MSELASIVAAETADAYRACQEIACSSRSSFYWAFSLLRPTRRRGMMALYAFARLVDDWGDSETSSRMMLGDWHNYIDQCAGQLVPKPSSTEALQVAPLIWQVAPAVHDMLHRFSMPPNHLRELVDGVASDRGQCVSIASVEELERYCHLVASSVGLACLSIWGGYRDENIELARACGLAFQYTNILRDIREDAFNSRIYIPMDWLQENGVERQKWLDGTPSGDWQKMLMRLAQEARVHYQTGWRLAAGLEPDSRRMFSMIWKTYRALLERLISRLDDLWLETKISLPRLTKIQLYMQHAFTPSFVRSTIAMGDALGSTLSSPEEAS